jgi:hypothetical protein
MNLQLPPFFINRKAEKANTTNLRSVFALVFMGGFLVLAFLAADPLLSELSAGLSIISGLLAFSQSAPTSKIKNS